MVARFIAVVISILITGCATTSKPNAHDRNFNATSLTVNLNSNGRQILNSVPEESTMDRFEMIDPQGRIISYIAFTDTDTGALIFVNEKLHGTLSRHDAQAFYSCRGYATVNLNHWAHDADDWIVSLLANSQPAIEVQLDFTGKSTTQSIKDVAESSIVKRLKSFFGMGANPLNIFNSLSTAQSDIAISNQFDKAQKGLSSINPGMSESSVTDIIKPEDISFVKGGMIMVYQSHTAEFYVTDGMVKVIQQPSFYFLSKTRAALFYAPKALWSRCTPLQWKEALPETY